MAASCGFASCRHPKPEAEAARRAPGQGCFGAWDAARASCLRRGEEQTNLQMQGLQLVNLVSDLRVHRSPGGLVARLAKLYDVLFKLELDFLHSNGGVQKGGSFTKPP